MNYKVDAELKEENIVVTTNTTTSFRRGPMRYTSSATEEETLPTKRALRRLRRRAIGQTATWVMDSFLGGAGIGLGIGTDIALCLLGIIGAPVTGGTSLIFPLLFLANSLIVFGDQSLNFARTTAMDMLLTREKIRKVKALLPTRRQ